MEELTRNGMEGHLTLGERLVKRGLISDEDLKRALRVQEEGHDPGFSRLVVDLGLISEEDLLPVLSDHFGISYVSLRDFPVESLSDEGLFSTSEFLKLARMVPLRV